MASRNGLLVVVILLILVPASACSTLESEVDAGASAPPAAGEVVLPINIYIPTTAEENAIAQARAILIDRCMRRFGLSFPRPPANLSDARVLDVGVYGNKRRYGVSDASVAQRYGYHLPSMVAGTRSGATSGAEEDRMHESEEFRTVLAGGPDGERLTVNGEEVPPGGCGQEATTEVEEIGGFSYSQVAAEIKADSYERSRTDADVISAFAEWAQCMAEAGYEVSVPVGEDPAFDLNDPRVSEAEIDMAMADVNCKEETDLIGIWSRTESRYQTDQIAEHEGELQDALTEHRHRMEAINDIVAAG
ncbi:hypothetical protein [Streptomyces millisiae]|uniref:Lipoprotein n=1 Tax=Streptomyces millisiae TaxID=3075542 RepID=A0ABU2LP34_9ACTN|nr:hypothetical protein [Streptomyces sp. DSM 44918]MDT0318823.1 hypothetical protein [Streptomyces sp. DSM 44918]